jgi:RimJ/RimL family protein N-acetyltransferase
MFNKNDRHQSSERFYEHLMKIGAIVADRNLDGSASLAHQTQYLRYLNPDVRGKGFSKEVMVLLESEVKKQGLSSIGLHVFGHNKTAIRLYEKSGYRVTNQVMMKEI